jgi:hypothetical protein
VRHLHVSTLECGQDNAPMNSDRDNSPACGHALVACVLIVTYASCVGLLFGERAPDARSASLEPWPIRMDGHVSVCGMPVVTMAGLGLRQPQAAEVPFVPKMSRTVAGNCLSSGLRSDFCIRQGEFDADPRLFYTLPTCRDVPQSDFLGACRMSADVVLDYCISRSDADARLCSRTQTGVCPLLYHETADISADVGAESVVSIPVNISLMASTTMLEVDMVYTTRVMDTHAGSTILVQLLSVNSGEAMLNPGISHAVHVPFGGSVFFRVRGALDSHAVGYHLSTLDLHVFGASAGSILTVRGVQQRLCAVGNTSVSVTPPHCWGVSTVQTAAISFSTGLDCSPYAYATVQLPLGLLEYTAVLVYATTRNPIGSPHVDSDTPYSEQLRLSDSPFGMTVLFGDMVVDTVFDIRNGPVLLVVNTTIAAMGVKLLFRQPAYGTISVYSLETPECLPQNTGRTVIATFSSRIYIPLDERVTMDTVIGQPPPLPWDGYLKFTYKQRVDLDLQFLSDPTRLYCLPVVDVALVGLVGVFYAVVGAGQVNWDMTSPVRFLGNGATIVMLLVGSQHVDLLTPAYRHGASFVYFSFLVCVHDEALLTVTRAEFMGRTNAQAVTHLRGVLSVQQTAMDHGPRNFVVSPFNTALTGSRQVTVSTCFYEIDQAYSAYPDRLTVECNLDDPWCYIPTASVLPWTMEATQLALASFPSNMSWPILRAVGMTGSDLSNVSAGPFDMDVMVDTWPILADTSVVMGIISAGIKTPLRFETQYSLDGITGQPVAHILFMAAAVTGTRFFFAGDRCESLPISLTILSYTDALAPTGFSRPPATVFLGTTQSVPLLLPNSDAVINIVENAELRLPGNSRLAKCMFYDHVYLLRLACVGCPYSACASHQTDIDGVPYCNIDEIPTAVYDPVCTGQPA